MQCQDKHVHTLKTKTETNQIPCDQGGMPKHVMDVWEEKIYTKLEVLSFEKAWDEIERDTIIWMTLVSRPKKTFAPSDEGTIEAKALAFLIDF